MSAKLWFKCEFGRLFNREDKTWNIQMCQMYLGITSNPQVTDSFVSIQIVSSRKFRSSDYKTLASFSIREQWISFAVTCVFACPALRRNHKTNDGNANKKYKSSTLIVVHSLVICNIQYSWVWMSYSSFINTTTFHCRNRSEQEINLLSSTSFQSAKKRSKFCVAVSALFSFVVSQIRWDVSIFK